MKIQQDTGLLSKLEEEIDIYKEKSEEEELKVEERVLDKIKKKKAAEKDGAYRSLDLCRREFMEEANGLLQKVWNIGKMPQDWKESIIK